MRATSVRPPSRLAKMSKEDRSSGQLSSYQFSPANRNRNRKRKAAGCIAVLVAVALGRPVMADSIYWQDSINNWLNVASWSDHSKTNLGGNYLNQVPGGSDHAFIQNGGTAQISGSAAAQNLTVGSGEIDLSSGALSVGTSEFMGNGGTAFFYQSGGANTIGSDFYVGDLTAGFYTLSAGTLTCNGKNERVGYSGTGIFNQSGGTNNTQGLELGYNPGVTGTYTLSGTGSLSAGQSQSEYVGMYGDGIFNQTGGTNTLTGAGLHVGEYAGATGTYNQTGGRLSGDEFYVGTSAGSTGTFTLGGSGSPTFAAHFAYVGNFGTGNFNQTGGASTIGTDLNVGLNAGSVGTYTLSGSGSLKVIGNENVGDSGTGTFTQTGGTHTITGMLTVATNDGSTGTYNLQGGTLTAGSIAVNSGGTLNIQTVQDPKTPLASSVTNSGTISLTAAGGNPAAAAVINGDYTQTAQGMLKLQIGGISAGQYATMAISGTAHLAGTLDVSWTGANAPALGNTFPIMTYGSVSGRFATMTGAEIQDPSGQAIAGASTNFFGLLYGSNKLNLVTLQVPQRVVAGLFTPLTAQQSSNLVLITHGTSDNAAPGGWVSQMASAIQHNINPKSGTWDVATFDWSQYSTDNPNDPNDPYNPVLAANRAIDIGESLANWMKEGDFSYNAVHTIGHSAGAWLTSYFGANIGAKYLQDTFLASFIPGPLEQAGGLGPVHIYPPTTFQRTGDLNAPQLGLNANYIDQYLDYRLGLGTNENLTNAYNVDVTRLDSSISVNPTEWHAWPYNWYIQTAMNPSAQSSYRLGFANSYESLGIPATTPTSNVGPLPLGKRLVLPNGYIQSDAVSQGISLLQTEHITSNTGTVTFDPSGQSATISTVPSDGTDVLASSKGNGAQSDGPSAVPTGDATMLTEFVSLTSSDDAIGFGGQFLSGGSGLLTIYFNGNEIAQADQSYLGSGPFDTSDLFLGQLYAPGTYSVLFRLDQYDGLQSSVEIADIVFSGPTSVPEPTALCLIALFGALIHRPRRIRRQDCDGS